MNQIKRKILVSIDDGNQLDLQMADLLLKYKIPTVFYISEGQIEHLSGQGSCLLCKEMKTLFDFGAHTLNHPEDLKRLDDSEAIMEIAGSKTKLEKIIKRPVTRFAYPSGRFNDRIKEIVKNTGFKEARTTKVLNIEFPKDSFETNPSIHIHPTRKEYNREVWLEVAYRLFDKVIKEGGRFELWGHSAEIERYNQWEFLEEFLGYMDQEMKKINYVRKI